jgi:hypothetical protein
LFLRAGQKGFAEIRIVRFNWANIGDRIAPIVGGRLRRKIIIGFFPAARLAADGLSAD